MGLFTVTVFVIITFIILWILLLHKYVIILREGCPGQVSEMQGCRRRQVGRCEVGICHALAGRRAQGERVGICPGQLGPSAKSCSGEVPKTPLQKARPGKHSGLLPLAQGTSGGLAPRIGASGGGGGRRMKEQASPGLVSQAVGSGPWGPRRPKLGLAWGAAPGRGAPGVGTLPCLGPLFRSLNPDG